MRTIHFLRNFLFGLAAIAGLGAVVMLLWNWLVPDIFGLKTINFWQSLGLFLLSHILLGGFGQHWGRHLHHHHGNPLNRKWLKMTPEEREEFVRKRNEQMEKHLRSHPHFHRHRRDDFFGRHDLDLTSDSAKKYE